MRRSNGVGRTPRLLLPMKKGKTGSSALRAFAMAAAASSQTESTKNDNSGIEKASFTKKLCLPSLGLSTGTLDARGEINGFPLYQNVFLRFTVHKKSMSAVNCITLCVTKSKIRFHKATNNGPRSFFTVQVTPYDTLLSTRSLPWALNGIRMPGLRKNC